MKTAGSFCCCKIIYQLQLTVTQVDGNFSFDDDLMNCHERVKLNKRKDFVKKSWFWKWLQIMAGRECSMIFVYKFRDPTKIFLGTLYTMAEGKLRI